MPTDKEWVNCTLSLTLVGEELRGQVRLPTSAVRVADLLPALHSLADALVGATTRRVEAQGKTISCHAGCAACCRGAVPVAQAEAIYLAELVDSMPPPGKAALRQRFEMALESLGRSRILGELRPRMAAGQPDIGRELAAAYFEQQVPCPFLEDECCSIYPHRPAVCREYLVTSPPSYCGDPEREIERVFLPARVSPVLFRFGGGIATHAARAVPLVMALAWAEGRGDEADKRFPGTLLFERFLREFSRSELGQGVATKEGRPPPSPG